MRNIYCFFLLILLSFSLNAQAGSSSQPRSLIDIFPNLSPEVREAVFTQEGYCKIFGKTSSFALVANSRSGINSQITDTVLNKQPGFLVETILVIPGGAGKYTLLDIYNALGKTRSLKGRLYHSFTRDENVPLFEEVTRIESERRNVPVNDPPPALTVPSKETVYMRLKDVNFGNSFYRGDMALFQRGLRYTLTNNKAITYFLVPVIKEEKFTAQLYFEPIAEGILIYGLAGADVSDFVSSRINMGSAISKRLAVIIAWVADGITG